MRYDQIPTRYGRWRHFTTCEETGQVAWAFGWGGECRGSGTAPDRIVAEQKLRKAVEKAGKRGL